VPTRPISGYSISEELFPPPPIWERVDIEATPPSQTEDDSPWRRDLDFDVVTAPNIGALVRSVKERLKSGNWIIQGGPFYLPNGFGQALSSEEAPKNV
jgi:hypothetical protein